MTLSKNLAEQDTDINQAIMRVLQQAFKYGIENDLIFGAMLEAGSEQGLFELSTLQNYVFGTRRVTPDGREFRYSKAGADITEDQVDYSLYYAAGPRNKWYEHPSQIQVAGDTTILLPFDEADTVIPAASTTVAVDELVGGYIVIYKNGKANQCVRRIIANTADSGVAHNVTITLEAPLPYDLALADGVELISNPWKNVRPSFAAPSANISMAGKATQVTGAGKCFWMQTKGVDRVSQNGTPADYERSAYWLPNGSTEQRDKAGVTSLDQRAGTLIIPGTAQSAFVMLDLP